MFRPDQLYSVFGMLGGIVSILVGTAVARAEQSLHEEACFRHPVAIVQASHPDQVLIANRRSGTVSRVDVSAGKVL
ncbi:MAG: hypothetical protein VX715_08730, partial [Planctomycetota bacterium]|nr:hypothetical protein [Planctomycetota bacterium]